MRQMATQVYVVIYRWQHRLYIMIYEKELVKDNHIYYFTRVRSVNETC